MSSLNRNPVTVIEVTPTLSTGAYTTLDQLGTLHTLTDAVLDRKSTCVLEDLMIVDKAAQGAELDIFFFDDVPTIAADADAFAVSDADMADMCIGHLRIQTTDYRTITTSTVANLKNIGLTLQSKSVLGANYKKIFAAVRVTGTPTYGAVDALVFKYKLRQD